MPTLCMGQTGRKRRNLAMLAGEWAADVQRHGIYMHVCSPLCMYVCSPYRVVTTDLGAFVLVSKRRVSELYEMLPALCVSLLVLPQFAKLKRVPYAHAAHMQPICSPASCMGCLD